MSGRRLIIVILIVAVVTGSFFGIRRLTETKAAAETGPETTPVIRGDITAVVGATGSIEAQDKISLSFKSPGRLATIFVKENQAVKAGEILAQQDTADLELQIKQSEATLRINQAKLAQLKVGPKKEDVLTVDANLASAKQSLASARQSLASAKENLVKIRQGPTSDDIDAAKADLALAQAKVEQAQSAYDKVAWRPDIGSLPQAANLQQATVEYERAQAVYNQKVKGPEAAPIASAQAQVSSAEAQVSSAEAQVVSAQAQVDKLKNPPNAQDVTIAEAQVSQAEASLAQTKLRLEDSYLKAPVGGVVAIVNGNVGEFTNAATPTVVLVDLSKYHITVNIDETDISRIQLGQTANLTLDAFPGAELQGEIRKVAVTASVQQGVVTFPVRIDVAKSPLPLKPGMTVNVNIVVDQKEGILLVPLRTIRSRQSDREKVVTVIQDGQPKAQVVKVGLTNDTDAEILSGLSEGDQVATSVVPTNNPLQGGFFGGGQGR
ncbi:MAG: efflux RND transporter periplasmic adaptor subunit [Chloroflexi bacterium]|nr:efflux RND transporter periplasmic adaptor subunit [Chloroflexota bacterium]